MLRIDGEIHFPTNNENFVDRNIATQKLNRIKRKPRDRKQQKTMPCLQKIWKKWYL
jgi:hypothetical protein